MSREPELSTLHDTYVNRVNTLLEFGREDLALEMSAGYAEERDRLLGRDAIRRPPVVTRRRRIRELARRARPGQRG